MFIFSFARQVLSCFLLIVSPKTKSIVLSTFFNIVTTYRLFCLIFFDQLLFPSSFIKMFINFHYSIVKIFVAKLNHFASGLHPPVEHCNSENALHEQYLHLNVTNSTRRIWHNKNELNNKGINVATFRFYIIINI